MIPSHRQRHPGPIASPDPAGPQSCGAHRPGEIYPAPLVRRADQAAHHPSPASLTAAALGWLIRHLDLYDPFTVPLPPEQAAFPEGPLLEFVILSRHLERAEHPLSTAQQRDLTATLKTASAIATRPDCQRRLRTPELFPFYAFLAILLAEVDLPGPGTQAEIQQLVNNGRVQVHDPSLTAYQQLELRYILDRGSIRHRLPPAIALAERCLPHAPDPSRLSDQDAYALTHSIFYLSDFAAHPVGPITTRQIVNTATLVEHLTCRYTAVGNWDLTAELLLAWRALRQPPTRIIDLAWAQLQQAQDDDGAVPGPHYDPTTAATIFDPRRRDIYRFRTSAHTTLVTAITASAPPEVTSQLAIRDLTKTQARVVLSNGQPIIHFGVRDPLEQRPGLEVVESGSRGSSVPRSDSGPVPGSWRY